MYEVIINGVTKLVDEKRLRLIKIVYGKNVEVEKPKEVIETKIVKTKKRKNGSM
jgi:hypothetical protein